MKKILAIIFFVGRASSAEELLRCPNQWAPSSGWIQRGASTNTQVTYAGMLIGPNDGNGDLRGIDRVTKKGRDVWFPDLNDYFDTVQKWVYCSYGPDSRLLRRVPDSTDQCVAKIEAKSITVHCK